MGACPLNADDAQSVPGLSDLVSPHTLEAWSRAGVDGGIPIVEDGANVLDFGAIADDDRDDTHAFQQAIDSVSGKESYAVYVPAGTFHLQSSLLIKNSAVLRGAGPENTTLVSTASGDAIRVGSSTKNRWIELETSSAAGSVSLELDRRIDREHATFIEIQRRNDATLMYSQPDWDVQWAQDAVGQVLPVESVSGRKLALAQPLAIGFPGKGQTRIRFLDLVTHVGIENLEIDRELAESDSGFSVHWKYAANVWLNNVHSNRAAPNHIGIAGVHACEVRNSYFHGASSRGTGGKGYGVKLGRHTTSCLVENNIFQDLRHSMLLHLGANNNVLAYNFSDNSRDHRGQVLPDIALHGHYPFNNLFEGNIVNEIAFGDFWGPAGPGNVSFRNCVTAEGIWLKDLSHSQAIIGNELLDRPGNVIYERDKYAREGIVVSANRVPADPEGKHIENIDSTRSPKVLPASLYRRMTPDSYKSPALDADLSALRWPFTGSDVVEGCSNPASRNYLRSLKR